MTSTQPFRPPFLRVFTRDYINMMLLLMPVVFAGIAIAMNVFDVGISRRGRTIGPDEAGFFGNLALIALVIAVPLLVFRVRSQLQFFARAAQVPGTITAVRLSGDRGRVEYSYEWQGEQIATGHIVSANATTKALQEGQSVQILVDPNNPKKSRVRDLYS